jgi:putative nucleotidyltransferase with HDIG domain
VVNLSEAAANAIGANGLLCRVGVYYHDVGKMLKPQYFIENQPGGRNPHDKLKPATSASIVREHVTEGIRLAREANLPDVLVDFIPEHHGTQEISFFLEREGRGPGGGRGGRPRGLPLPGPPAPEPGDRHRHARRLGGVGHPDRPGPHPERHRDLIDTSWRGRSGRASSTRPP